MTDFLLELLSEEIPARMQDKARADLARLFGEELAKAGLQVEAVETYATPRRLALIAKGLPLKTAAVSEETKGPKTSAPPQALEGFLRKTGLTQDELEERDGIYFAVVEKPGRKTVDVLAEAIPAIIRAFQWPKSMRWGAASLSTESLRWVRPLQGIVALLGDTVVPCQLPEISAGSTTTGHRFHHSGLITIGNASTYVSDLRAAHVIVDQDERRAIIRAGAEKAAGAAGLVLVEDEGLVAENAGLTEWPVPMLGRFDPAFLEVPEEVIQLTARVNQKYFICRDSAGKLANAFICTANLEPSDGGATVVAGNEKVLAARLSDAKFFWEQDLKVRLEDQATKLSQIVFHEKLGTVADKVERVAKLARWLVTSGVIPAKAGIHKLMGSENMDSRLRGNDEDVKALAQMAERAARLCKADLVTGMVGEFPELQGVMGGYYASAQGYSDAIADAIRDHYKPVGQGDDVPTAPVTVAVSLADKLDTFVGFFAINEKPTGSKDPFALRRAIIAIASLIERNGLRFSIGDAFEMSLKLHRKTLEASDDWFLLFYPLENFRGIMKEMRPFDAWEPDCRVLAVQTFDDIEEDGLHSVASFIGDGHEFHPEVDYDKFSRVIETQLAGIDYLLSSTTGFLIDRLKVQQREAGVRHDLIDAVFALGGEDDLVRLLARVKALQAFVGTDAGANLLAGYKRAANILKQAGGDKESRHPELVSGSMTEQTPTSQAEGWMLKQVQHDGVGVEADLLKALDTAEPLATSAIEREDFEGAMSALSILRAPIDAFFEGVMVNDPDPQKRAYRIGLLGRFVSAVHRVADFSKIEG
jgi:glycyl-tRNA synthetase beta chain